MTSHKPVRPIQKCLRRVGVSQGSDRDSSSGACRNRWQSGTHPSKQTGRVHVCELLVGQTQDPHTFEFCESGAKATAWDLTAKRVDPDFFSQHTLAELNEWHDHELEEAGRLWPPSDGIPHPTSTSKWRGNRHSTRSANELEALDPTLRCSIHRAGHRWKPRTCISLFARMYGTNNLPDSSNMCHESTSVGLKKSIGVGVGTITLEDFEHTDLIFFFGQNVGTNSPRMLHRVQDARKRGVPIITFNPIREPGLVKLRQSAIPIEMLTPGATQISTQYHQVKTGGDIGGDCRTSAKLCWKRMIGRAAGEPRLLDSAFIAATHDRL